MIVGVLLAAGCSHRFGGDKRLLSLENGVPMAVQSLRNMQSAVDRLVVVVRDDSDPLLEVLCSETCETLICPDAEMGMGHTLSHAVRESRGAEGWLVGLADMPFIKPSTCRLVANATRQGFLISRPCYQQRPGHPVGFSKNAFDELSVLCGDQGARQFIHKLEIHIRLIECVDPGVLIDVDYPQDVISNV